MPELPEVETVRRSLLQLIINKKIKDVDVFYSKIVKNVLIDDFVNLLKNQTFKDIKRKGKYLIFILDDIILVSHLRMEGKYLLRKNEEIGKHEHIVFTFFDGTTLRYHDTRKFGTMYIFKTTNILDIIDKQPLCNVGYDPFEQELTIDELYKRFQKISKPIKSTLLDQSVISGLGNIYVDEVCFMSKLHPLTPTKSLSMENVTLIVNNAKIVLTKAITLGGTTIKSFLSSHEISGKFQNELLVHTRDICPNCGQKILKIRVGGRGTYYCENCQKKLDKE